MGMSLRTMPLSSFSAGGLLRRLSVAAPLSAAFLVAGCTGFDDIPKHVRPLPSAVKAELVEKKMRERDPILVRIFKEESELEVWKVRRETGRFALFKTYDICKWSGKLGPKIKEGDRQAPEGFYTVTPAQMNPRSSYHLSFNIGFPNAYDRAHERTGSHLMVHGACSSAGCYSMEDEQIQEIYTLARLAFQGGQRSFQVQAYPFRMTPANLARQRNDPNYPFWKMLKEGHDHFEVTHQQPKISVCSMKYVFNATVQDGIDYSPTGECPPEMTVNPRIKQAVSARMARDDAKETIIAAKLQKKGNGNLFGIGRDGGSETAVAMSRPSETVPLTTASTSPQTTAPAGEGSGVPRAKPKSPQAVAAYSAQPERGSTGIVKRLFRKFW